MFWRVEYSLSLPDREFIVVEIANRTDRTLEITDRNRQCLWGLLFAAPFLAIGLGVGAATVKVTTLLCRRESDNRIDCERKVMGILGVETDRIAGLQKATTVKTSGTGVVLSTTAGRVELAPYRTFVTDRHFQTTKQLNKFINNPLGIVVYVVQDDRFINSLWSGNFAICGLVCALFSLAIPIQVSCKLDRNFDRLTLTKGYLLYGNRQTELPLSTIDRAQLRKLPVHLNHQPLYTIDLIPRSGKKVSLSVPSKHLAVYQQTIDTTNDFIHQLGN